MLKIEAVCAFRDNYIWVLRREGNHTAAAVDPGDSVPLRDYLEKERLTLTDILITHHHPDHTGGVKSLVEQFSPRVHAPANERTPVACATHKVTGGDNVVLDSLDVELQVIDIPGHTLGHIAFWGDNKLFCGDTLFSAGCGRIFEGDARQMQDSLARLAALPESTEVYCGHEYTCKNLSFALSVEPGNRQAARQLEAAQSARSRDKPTLPSSIGLELEINPFLRCDQPDV
ncbi:MAG TPA: hydroxyacylglutathione hydrolase, partial [Beutenbergiaceae bacterium]|nr:hydroxyacylglutathione hydrolase [Beutenbergiaceae bacterium]